MNRLSPERVATKLESDGSELSFSASSVKSLICSWLFVVKVDSGLHA